MRLRLPAHNSMKKGHVPKDAAFEAGSVGYQSF